jgi:hypothetical protein
MSSTEADVSVALDAIRRWGFILLQDPTLPNLASLIAGKSVRGSWWGHPAGSRIFNAGGVLDEHRDVACFKLVDGKVCFVHRRLWRALRAIGRAREKWQTQKLESDAKALLARVDSEHCVLASGKAAKVLEARLLVVGHQVHTESGAHKNELMSWKRFSDDRALAASDDPSPDEAKKEIEDAVRAMSENESRKLPWGRVSSSGS